MDLRQAGSARAPAARARADPCHGERVRWAVIFAGLVAGCGGAPVRARVEDPITPPRARLLDEDLRAPEGAAAQDDFRLEMPALGSDLPSVIVVPSAEEAP